MDVRSFEVTRRLIAVAPIAGAQIWLMIRAALDDSYHPEEEENQEHFICSRRGVHASYVERLRHQFMHIFIDFVPAQHLCGRNDYAPGR